MLQPLLDRENLTTPAQEGLDVSARKNLAFSLDRSGTDHFPRKKNEARHEHRTLLYEKEWRAAEDLWSLYEYIESLQDENLEEISIGLRGKILEALEDRDVPFMRWQEYRAVRGSYNDGESSPEVSHRYKELRKDPDICFKEHLAGFYENIMGKAETVARIKALPYEEQVTEIAKIIGEGLFESGSGDHEKRLAYVRELIYSMPNRILIEYFDVDYEEGIEEVLSGDWANNHTVQELVFQALDIQDVDFSGVNVDVQVGNLPNRALGIQFSESPITLLKDLDQVERSSEVRLHEHLHNYLEFLQMGSLPYVERFFSAVEFDVTDELSVLRARDHCMEKLRAIVQDLSEEFLVQMGGDPQKFMQALTVYVEEFLEVLESDVVRQDLTDEKLVVAQLGLDRERAAEDIKGQLKDTFQYYADTFYVAQKCDVLDEVCGLTVIHHAGNPERIFKALAHEVGRKKALLLRQVRALESPEFFENDGGFGEFGTGYDFSDPRKWFQDEEFLQGVVRDVQGISGEERSFFSQIEIDPNSVISREVMPEITIEDFERTQSAMDQLKSLGFMPQLYEYVHEHYDDLLQEQEGQEGVSEQSAHLLDDLEDGLELGTRKY